MILHYTIPLLLLLPLLSVSSYNFTRSNQNKAKRTISDQIYSHGDAKAVLFYMENPQTAEIPELQTAASSPGLKNFYSAPAKPLALVSVQQPIQVFEQDSPKQVAEQQVLYEFQQTPTNAVSNVHVKQLFQPSVELTTQNPSYQGQPSEHLSTVQPLGTIHPSTPIITATQPFIRSQPQAVGLAGATSYHPATSATIVSPVHHNIYTNHGFNTASFSSHNPLLPESQQYQNTQISPKQVPGKYIYLNGKIVYNPAHIVPQAKVAQNSLYHKGIYHNQQKLPLINYSQRHNTPVAPQGQVHGNLGASQNYRGAKLQEGLTPPALLPPITRNRFQAPKQLHQIDKPSAPVRQEEADEEEEQPEDEDDEENAEDDEEESETDNQEDEKDSYGYEDDSYGYEKTPFEDDDYLNEDESHYFRPSHKNKGRSKNREHDQEEDVEDTNRDSSNSHSKYNHHPSKSRKHRNPPQYESGENYGFYEGYSSNTKYKSPKNGKKNGKKEKPIGKYKKVKVMKINGGKPRVETIEGRFSENVPITHKQKMFKERWFVTKDIEGAGSKKLKNIK